MAIRVSSGAARVVGDVTLRLDGVPHRLEASIDLARGVARIGNAEHRLESLAFDVPVRGTVYVALLNYRENLQCLGEAMTQPPYKAPPRAPVLGIKPANTLTGHGTAVPVPGDSPALATGPSLAIVIGRVACRVPADRALEVVAGYTVANDVSVPHDSYLRPAVRLRCRDRFCPIGPWITPAGAVPNPDALAIEVSVNGVLALRASTASFVRPVARLLADVTEFMTLLPGDVLLTGTPQGAPLARPGDRVAIDIPGVGRLENVFAACRRTGAGEDMGGVGSSSAAGGDVRVGHAPVGAPR